MRDDENITTFMPRVNELVCGIRNASGVLDENEIVCKILRSLPAAYKIKVAAIDEFRAHTTVTREKLAGKLAAFEMTKFGDDHPKTESAFKSSAYVKGKQRFDLGENSSKKLSWYDQATKDMEEEEAEIAQLEALIVKRLPKGSSKYEGKLPFKCFNCNKIGHFASRCLERSARSKSNRQRFQKNYYYVHEEDDNEGVIDDEPKIGNRSRNEWVLIAIKEEDPISSEFVNHKVVERALATQVEEKDDWVIDSGCSHHMTGDKNKFLDLERYEGGMVKFGDNFAGRIRGRGTISFDGKSKTGNYMLKD